MLAEGKAKPGSTRLGPACLWPAVFSTGVCCVVLAPHHAPAHACMPACPLPSVGFAGSAKKQRKPKKEKVGDNSGSQAAAARSCAAAMRQQLLGSSCSGAPAQQLNLCPACLPACLAVPCAAAGPQRPQARHHRILCLPGRQPRGEPWRQRQGQPLPLRARRLAVPVAQTAAAGSGPADHMLLCTLPASA